MSAAQENAPAVEDHDDNTASPVKEKKQKAEKKEKKPEDERFRLETGTGLVKAVPSADQIVILQIDAQAKNPPRERRISLSNLDVPNLAQPKRVQIAQAQREAEKANEEFDESKVDIKTDEPFAFASREFMRKLLVGKQVTFVIEAKLNRDYGFVYLVGANPNDEPKDVTELLLGAGLAKIREAVLEDPRPGMEGWLAAQDQAESGKLGLWSTDKNSKRNSVRKPQDEVDSASFFERNQDKEISAVVELVRSASLLKVVLPSGEEASVYVSGIEAPERGAPFEKESKFFAEAYALHRDVTLLLEGADRSGLYCTVLIDDLNLAEELLRAGLVRFVEWSANRSKNVKALRAAEDSVKKSKLRLYQGGAKSAEKPTPKGVRKEVVGKVTSVVSSGQIQVLEGNGTEHKVYLSSIRVPRAERRSKNDGEEEEASDDFSKVQDQAFFEGKEALRRELISKRVRCVLDYTREVGKENEVRAMYSVYSLDSKKNVAVDLVAQGFAFAIAHRGNEDRSKEYGDLIQAEAEAKRDGRGVWNKADNLQARRPRDLTLPENLGDAKQFFTFLKRGGRLRGVVEHEFSPSKLKVLVPKEDVYVAISLTGIRTPLMRLPNKEKNPLAIAALKRVAELAHQQEIEFEIMAQDKTGGFIGNVYLPRDKVPLAVHLLEEGHASIHRASLSEVPNERDFEIAEESAKHKKLGVWENFDPAVEEAKRLARQKEREERDAPRKPQQELHDVVVTEIIDGAHFFVQMVGDEARQLETLMADLQKACESAAAFEASKKDICAAQFTADDQWYRARVDYVDDDEGTAQVLYVDYGNTESLPLDRLRTLDAKFKKLPHQAVEAELAYIKVPRLDQDFGREAAEFLAEFTNNKELMANVEYRDDTGKMYLSLGDRSSQEHIGAALLRAGLARVESGRGSRWSSPIKAKLREEEDKARTARLGIFAYGDPGSSDDEL